MSSNSGSPEGFFFFFFKKTVVQTWFGRAEFSILGQFSFGLNGPFA